MKESSVDFYFFSGTGNTLLAARAVAGRLREGGKRVRLRRMEKGFVPFQDDGTALGIAVTVAMFSTYPFAWEFLEKLPDGGGRGAFLVSTMGQTSGGLRPAMKKLFTSKHYTPLGAREFVMPSNYNNTTIPVAANREKIETMERDAALFAESLLEGRAVWEGGNILSPLFYRLSRRQWPWRLMRKKYPLTVDRGKCIKCGKCARLCPAKNIRMAEYPEFLDHCVSCQRCVAFCPPMAIGVQGKNYRQYRSVEYGDLVSENL
ncbi:EFR1 family ferrodoxin [Aminivibrio sp.]|jgi:ferredoxin|uniref:EFR1 family ferrodoxin n=1 Tax=Aminivibrio sp. TaxID=1872489 RepID=UPI001A518A21|nr:EFR1 family ferrodoxin [Aminivibrio sp.]MBL3540224.1 EFR1 family ferrodoxin [Aminivibrio sp.]